MWKSRTCCTDRRRPPTPTYFSGAPVLYPPLAALADDLGGVAGARLLSPGLHARRDLPAVGRHPGCSVAGRRCSRPRCSSRWGPPSSWGLRDLRRDVAVPHDGRRLVRGRGREPGRLHHAADRRRRCARAGERHQIRHQPFSTRASSPSAAWSSPKERGLKSAARPRRLTSPPWSPAAGRGLLALGGASYVTGVMSTTLARAVGGSPASVVLADSASGSVSSASPRRQRVVASPARQGASGGRSCPLGGLPGAGHREPGAHPYHHVAVQARRLRRVVRRRGGRLPARPARPDPPARRAVAVAPPPGARRGSVLVPVGGIRRSAGARISSRHGRTPPR